MSFFNSNFIRIALVILLGVATAIAFKFSATVNSVTESGVIMALPEQIGAFTGKDEEPSEGEKHVLPSDTDIVKKSYRDPDGNVVNAQIVLAGAEKRSIHRPELCLPAQGWSINQRETMMVKLTNGRSLSIMNDFISRPVETSPGVTHPLESYYSYCFVGNGVTTSSHLMRLFLTSWDRVVHHKNHRWAYMAVSAPVLENFKKDGKNAQQTKQMISDFISEMAPQVMKSDEDKR
jgi:EpsI family protein